MYKKTFRDIKMNIHLIHSSSIIPIIYLSVIHPSIYPLICYVCIHPYIFPSIHVYSCIYPSFYYISCIHLFIHLSFHVSIYSLLFQSICPSIYSRTCLWRPLVGLDKSGRHREVAAICRSYVSQNFKKQLHVCCNRTIKEPYTCAKT